MIERIDRIKPVGVRFSWKETVFDVYELSVSTMIDNAIINFHVDRFANDLCRIMRLRLEHD